jgi:microcystin-dependent protein
MTIVPSIGAARGALVASLLALATAAPAQALSQNDYLGAISLAGFSGFCPVNTLPAAGQLLQINQNLALFALLGTTYGGDAKTTFGLPDLRGLEPSPAASKADSIYGMHYCITINGIFPSRP